MKKNLNDHLLSVVLIFLIVVVFAFSLQSYLLNAKTFDSSKIEYTHYNNYIIFKQSFHHLIHRQDLYKLYPNEYWDYFKYSPAFALLMAPLSVLPDFAGLFLWNLFNALLLTIALWKLPFKTNRIKLFVMGFVIVELITALQNVQSNALMAGFIVFSFLFMEKNKPALATLFIVLSVFVKIFGVVAVLLLVFYPDKIKSALYTLGWTVLFLLFPLVVISPSHLLFLYQSWAHLILNDVNASLGLSVMGWIDSWLNIEIAKNAILTIGTVLLVLPLLKFSFYSKLEFRLLFLSSLLIWVVIFNPKAESPTFVIAITGVAIWFFPQKLTIENLFLLVLTFVFTELSPTDIFPKVIRTNYFIPYVVKAVPCILVWFKVIYDIIFFKPEGLHQLKLKTMKT